MNKAKLTERFGVKLLAWFLLALSVLGLMVSAVGIYAAWELDVYTAASAEALKRTMFSDICISDGDSVVRVVAGDGQPADVHGFPLCQTHVDEADAEIFRRLPEDAGLAKPRRAPDHQRRQQFGLTRVPRQGVEIHPQQMRKFRSGDPVVHVEHIFHRYDLPRVRRARCS